ncbi:MAG TPA: hypothetical protein VKH15_04105 [Candidatus Acidoferrum sp.]|nr:hypothetical protein [Candidatus Acidoferrum sp.]
MFCPQCKAEYRQGFTRCADCDLELVDDLPSQAIAAPTPVDPEVSDEDPFCSFWKGEDPRIHAELCGLLAQQNIPYKTFRRSDHLFNISTKALFEIGIPFSFFEKAEAAVKEAYEGVDEPATEDAPRLALPESIEPRE